MPCSCPRGWPRKKAPAVRRANDFYETPPWMTRALLRYVKISGRVYEPCVGDHSIGSVLADAGLHVISNDIDSSKAASHHFDASTEAAWTCLREPVDWVVTNPPYTAPLPMEILKRALTHARVGVALMLRISWLEPTKDPKKHPRGPFLSERPPDMYLVMPRHSFTGNGSSDSATTAWMIWSRYSEPLRGRAIECCYGAENW